MPQRRPQVQAGAYTQQAQGALPRLRVAGAPGSRPVLISHSTMLRFWGANLGDPLRWRGQPIGFCHASGKATIPSPKPGEAGTGSKPRAVEVEQLPALWVAGNGSGGD